MKKIQAKKANSRTNLERRDALKKAGMFAAFTAASSLLILSPKKAQADSAPSPGWGS